MKKQFHISTIPLFVCIGFLCGLIIIRIFNAIVLIPLMIATGIICFIISILSKNIMRIIFSSLAGILLGACRSSVFNYNQKILEAYYDNDIVITGTVQSSSIVKNRQSRLQLSDLAINDDVRVNDCQVYVMLANSDSYERSERITLRGKFQAGFGDYSGYL